MDSDSDDEYYFSYCKLNGYRNEKNDINSIKNYKNYNFKSRNGRRYKTIITHSTKNIETLMGYRKILKEIELMRIFNGINYYEYYQDNILPLYF